MEQTLNTEKRAVNPKKWKMLKRIGFHIDMTPYVDVIMLLLTFFIMTTALNQPQVMQINLPKSDEVVPINMGNVVYVRVTGLGNIGLSKGKEDGTEELPVKVSLMQMRQQLEKWGSDNKEMVMILKFHRGANYELMVNIIDEINSASINKRFSFSKMLESDGKILALIDG